MISFSHSDAAFAGGFSVGHANENNEQERFGKLEGLTFTWVGDGNNVLHDLMLGCAKLGEMKTQYAQILF